MTLRWRELLDHLGVESTDSSRYAGRGWIACKCPWCGHADPSMHLGINEEHGFYRCLRNEQHRGKSPYFLLRGLGVNPTEMDGLLTAFGGISHGSPPPRPVRFEPPTLARRWQRMQPASTDLDTMNYLERRGFTKPHETADTFDLRVGVNTLARRVWFKLTDLNGQVVGFTGRAIDDWRTPRYYTETAEVGLYMPRRPTARHRLVLLVEGPLDALKVADATRRRANLFIAALCGLSVTGNKRLQLMQLARTMPSFAVALDRTVWANDAQRLIAELRAIPALGKIRRLAMPADIDDPGEMTTPEVERWLATI